VGEILSHGIPVVAIDRDLHDRCVDTVLADNEGGAYRATRHLLGQGFSRIGCITGPAERTTADDRLTGHVRAHREVGLRVDEALARRSNFRQRGGATRRRTSCSSADRPDALLVANNLMTVGALEAVAQPSSVGPPVDVAPE